MQDSFIKWGWNRTVCKCHVGVSSRGSCRGISYPAQDVRIGHDDAQVDVNRRHEPALELEVAKLDGLHAQEYFGWATKCMQTLTPASKGHSAHLNFMQTQHKLFELL